MTDIRGADDLFRQRQLLSALSMEVAAVLGEADWLNAEADRLRDPAQTYTSQQLRNDLARLADDVARLGRDLVHVVGLIVPSLPAQPVPPHQG